MSRVAPGQSCPVCGLTQGAYTPAPHHLPLGTVLAGRYLVGRALGEGGFGITYIGCDLRLEMKVAIKEYFPVDRVSRYSSSSLSVVSRAGTAGQDYSQGLKRFLYEARTMARMEKQPQIVMVRDYFEANNTAYIVMEYVEGTNFMDLAAQRGGRIPAGELLPLIEPLFSALSAVHAAGLIHRDISPDNLMLERGTVRLLDFGCARESARGTETMTIALKQGYAPIEQYQRKGQGPWTDVYALSATIYYCLTGKVPPQSLDRILEDELIPPRDLGVDLTPGQQKALLKGMEIQPRRRYQTVEELHVGLYHPTEPLEAPAPPQPVPTIQPEQKPEPEPEPAPDLPTPEEPQATRPGLAAWLQSHKKLCAAVGGGTAAVLILAAALPGLISSAPVSENTLPPVSESSAPGDLSAETAVSQLDQDAMFAGAVTVTTPEELVAALADENVPSVICQGDFHLPSALDTAQWLEITKPVLLSQESSLGISSTIVIREGGTVWVEGQVHGAGCIYTCGGTVVTDTQCGIGLPLYLTKDGDLVNRGVALDVDIQNLITPELYTGAKVVTTFQEFQTAVNGWDTSAIRVDGAIELPGEITVEVPLIITENGSISSGDGCTLNVTNRLLNYGTITAPLWLGGSAAQLVNYGRIAPENGLWLGSPDISGTRTAFNLGEISIQNYSTVWCDLVNLGAISTEGGAEAGGLHVDQCTLFNYGTLHVAENMLVVGQQCVNAGTLQVDGRLEVAGLLKNNGVLTVTSTGTLENVGLMDLYDYDCTLTVEEGGSLDTESGVLLTRTQNEISGEIQGTLWTVDFTSIDGDQSEKAYVSDGEALLAALADPAVDTVIVDGSITLSQDLTITKSVYVRAGPLTMADGASITVDGAILCVNSTLACDDLTLKNGAMMELIGSWQHIGTDSTVRLTGGSWLFTRDSYLTFSSLALEQVEGLTNRALKERFPRRAFTWRGPKPLARNLRWKEEG